MARSESGVAPHRRGLVWAVSLGCFLVLAAVLLFTGKSKNADPDAAESDSAVTANSVMNHIGNGARNTSASTTDTKSPNLDNVDKQTMANKAKGAIVGVPTILSSNSLSLNGQTFVLWAVLSPIQQATCYTNGRPWQCGIESLKATNQVLRSHQLAACFDMGFDERNRTVGRCVVGLEDVAGKLVRAGWALTDRDIDQAYSGDQSDARFKKKGLWSSQFRMEEFTGN
jgi:endonuclease YncB( thermonuclease family)